MLQKTLSRSERSDARSLLKRRLGPTHLSTSLPEVSSAKEKEKLGFVWNSANLTLEKKNHLRRGLN